MKEFVFPFRKMKLSCAFKPAVSLCITFILSDRDWCLDLFSSLSHSSFSLLPLPPYVLSVPTRYKNNTASENRKFLWMLLMTTHFVNYLIRWRPKITSEPGAGLDSTDNYLSSVSDLDFPENIAYQYFGKRPAVHFRILNARNIKAWRFRRPV